MRRGWAAAIGLAGLVLGLRWLAVAAEGARAERAQERAGVVLDPGWEPAPDPLAGDPSTPLAPGAEPGRAPEPLVASRAAELARAHWVEGRVVFPVGTPPDEVCSVVAEGRAFSDGTIHRCRVEPDGRFRVAFSPGAKAGWIGLEARYLRLRGQARWLRSLAREEVTLAPDLGGVITGRLIVPIGASGRSPSGEVVLTAGPTRRAPLRAGGEFVFERVPSGKGRVVAYRGSNWVVRSTPFELAPGETKRLDLELVPGVVLGGKVRDAHGRGIAGARILAQGSMVEARSRGDGSFRLPALEAGNHTLLVSCEGYLPAKRALGSFKSGARRSNLGFVLERGAAITGTVLHPGGGPEAASVRVTPEPDGAPGSRSASCRSASDGTFRIQGLLPGAYRVEAWKVICGRKFEVSRQQVVAGTSDLVLQLDG